ncbi:hypothetical protein C0991_005588 [Blastosporella zonata]|nr:hypothetical protein C0991_005588 [Blastosporella zonata]
MNSKDAASRDIPSSSSGISQISPPRQSLPKDSPSSLDIDAKRNFTTLSQHILKLEKEIADLKMAHTLSSSSEETSSSPAASTRVVQPPVTVLDKTALVDADVHLSNQLKRMTLSSNHERHFGFSSSMSLLGVALQVGKAKNKVPIAGDNRRFRRPEFWSIHPVSLPGPL